MPKQAKKKTTKKKSSTKGKGQKKGSAKKKGEGKSRAAAQELKDSILKLMRKGKAYTSREVVEGLGRTPGKKEGGPVVNALKRLAEEGLVKYGPNEEYPGYVWEKN